MGCENLINFKGFNALINCIYKLWKLVIATISAKLEKYYLKKFKTNV